VILFLLVSELNLDATRFEVSGITLTNLIPYSPTYGLAIPLFLALLLIMRSQLAENDDDGTQAAAVARQHRIGAGLVVTALLLALSATKTPAAVDLLGGLALYSIWRYLTSKPAKVLVAYLAVTTVAVTVVTVTMIASSSTLHIGFFEYLHYTIFVGVFSLPPILTFFAVPTAVVVSSFLLFAPLFAAGWLLVRHGNGTPIAGLLVSIFVCSLGAYLLLGAPSEGQAYFMVYGYIAMLPLAATGLVGLWNDLGQNGRRRMGWACLAILVLGLTLAESSQLLSTGNGSPTGRVLAWYAIVYGLVAVTLLWTCIWLERSLAPSIRRRTVRVAACSIPLLTTLGAVKVLGTSGPALVDAFLGRKPILIDSANNRGMTAALYRGLIWVRDHTSPCAVLAVNNHYRGAAMKNSSYFYYSAFTEREVYLESWNYTVQGVHGQQPFPRRLALNDAATIAGRASALRGLQREGVSYVLIDKIHGPDPKEPANLARPVFSNGAVAVYRLIAPSAGTRPGACVA
jgi:hypothetical protein